jgi:hypothetical protein
MTNPEENMQGQTTSPKPSSENGDQESVRRSESITEEELTKQFEDKDMVRVLSELLKAQKIAAIYIDQRNGGVFFSDEAHISGDVVGHNQFKQGKSKVDRIRLGETVSQILVSDLKKVLSVYVPSRRYETARETLVQQHLLILWGCTHHGKWTTALNLLHDLHGEIIFELDPVANPEALDFTKSQAQGNVIDTFSAESVEKLTLFQLNRLRDELQASGAHLVITVDERVKLSRENFEHYLVNWDDLPNQNDLLDKHLDWYTSNSVVRDKAATLCTENEVQSILNQPLLPGEVDQLAKLLIDAAADKYKLTETLERFEARTSQQVACWFEDHQALEDRALLLSAAVYNRASYYIVINAEKRLRALLPQDEGNKPTASGMFGSTRSKRIQSIGADLKSGYEDTEFGHNPVETVELNNPAMQSAIIQYAWKEFDRLREVIVHWLGEAVIDTSFDMRMRAAAAVGELSKHDFGYIRREILIPWGTHPDCAVRALASFALGIPAWESEKAPLVLGLLHHWSTLNNWRLCWTAAAAYGGLVGLRFPEAALRDLYRIAQSGDLRLLGVLMQSISNLFNAGEIVSEYRKKVLDSLVEWTEKPKDIAGHTGVFVFLHLADTALIESDPEGDPWPTLLWLIRQDESQASKVLALWRQALNLKNTRSAAFSTLRNWLKAVEQDSRLYENLAWLFQEIIYQGPEREAERLIHYLRRLNDQPEAILSAGKILKAL